MSQNRVLIVDDDPRICSFVSRVAKTKGYEACAIERPEQFADSYFNFDPSLIMLDLQMGKQDGIEILRFLASHQVKIPIVLMSGVERSIIESASLFAKSMHLKIANACSKPFESELLTNIFNRYYKNQEAERPADKIHKKEIIQAMENGAMCVYFQPVYSLLNKESYALEFLARWKNSHDHLRLPNEFMRSIENYGLLEKFTFYVLEAGLEKCQPLLERNGQIKISINLTIKLLKNIEFPDRLSDMLNKFGISPEKVVLEIQNFAYLKNISSTLDILSRLRLKGFMLAIDNFDSNSIAIIKQYKLPFTEVKFSYDLLKDLADKSNGEDKTVLLIESIRRLGLDCCVKGIDSKEKFTHAKELDIELVQGHYICKPLPATAICAWM